MQEWGQVDLHKAKGNKNVRKAHLTKFSKTPYNNIIILPRANSLKCCCILLRREGRKSIISQVPTLWNSTN